MEPDRDPGDECECGDTFLELLHRAMCEQIEEPGVPMPSSIFVRQVPAEVTPDGEVKLIGE